MNLLLANSKVPFDETNDLPIEMDTPRLLSSELFCSAGTQSKLATYAFAWWWGALFMRGGVLLYLGQQNQQLLLNILLLNRLAKRKLPLLAAFLHSSVCSFRCFFSSFSNAFFAFLVASSFSFTWKALRLLRWRLRWRFFFSLSLVPYLLFSSY